MTDKKKIYVTRPALPPLEEFEIYLKQMWETGWLTNNGPFHIELENKLRDFLQVDHISLFSNGTIALITALQALDLKGEIITTPYSFVATSHAIKWNGLTPVFADIDDNTCNLDPRSVEKQITQHTSAILPVHVYGIPCDIDALQKIADKYRLKIIYDAAHAFNVKLQGRSILNFGDLTVLSFHATKAFHTFEGGAIVSHSAEQKAKIDFLKNFGFADELTIVGVGINGKMNEVQASMGLLQLKYFNNYVEQRKQISSMYLKKLNKTPGIRIPIIDKNLDYNYSYFPVFINSQQFGNTRDGVYNSLKDNDIYARRYFYPLISNLPSYRSVVSASPENLPVANRIADVVLCLPLYPGLSEQEISEICEIIQNCYHPNIKNN
ncbi:MAG: DegT/DnrJ/EryC1/StrS family aminotransferase [Bacteroidales bacterium]|nr:DegT/DnrJ/EryC1/StrS family aminotransferase [Bacteroidales bacterium]HOY39414.1 DegT/DnrJ/EryC1/StrS family aminotransferase [Bacteroidales bacterium]HQP04374.1 DegT/DnrJ/EryC1/StrS family aminotransferase [Bacteroidales bacterium]